MRLNNEGSLVPLDDDYRKVYVPAKAVQWVIRKLSSGSTYAECKNHPMYNFSKEEVLFIHLTQV